MKKQLGMMSSLVIVMTFLMAFALAAPVDAKKPVRGDMDLDFNVGFFGPPALCSEVTWAGSITIDGVDYGMTFIPTDDHFTGPVHHFEEIWQIHAATFEFDGGVFTECNLPVVMAGLDVGIAAPNLNGVAHGTVEFVDPEGPFEDSLMGRRVHWSGVVSESGVQFAGPFRIN